MKNCKHKNLYPDYTDGGGCETPYCGWEEVHCKDCGRFIVTCGCGWNNSQSGWPMKRHRKIERKKNKCPHCSNL
jgi:hypothetical protein